MAISKIEVIGEAESMLPPEVKSAIDVVRKFSASPEKLADLKGRLVTAKAQSLELKAKWDDARRLIDRLEDEIETMEKRAEMINKIEGVDED